MTKFWLLWLLVYKKSWQSGKCREGRQKEGSELFSKVTNWNKRHFNADIRKANELATSWAIFEKWTTNFCETVNSRKDLRGGWESIKQKELWVRYWNKSEWSYLHTPQVRLLSDWREGENPTGCKEDQNEYWKEKEKCFTEIKNPFNLSKGRYSGNLIIIAPSGENPTH